MLIRRMLCSVLSLSILLAHQPLLAAALPIEWPKDLDNGDHRIEVYQPQIESWSGSTIGGRVAIALGDKTDDKKEPVYGVAHFTAQAKIDQATGLAQLSQIRVSQVDVPTQPQAAASSLALLKARMPAQMTVSVDQLQTSYAVSQQKKALGAVEVKNDPPTIVFASNPTLIVHVQGDPALRPVPKVKGFQRVLNSQALILADDQGAWHLTAAGYWFRSTALTGPWLVNAQPSQALLAAAKAVNASGKTDAMLPADGKKAPQPPAVLVATKPTELVVTDGPPKPLPVAGTTLLSVSNADHALFVDTGMNEYYLLVSGRWFRAKSYEGPWTYVPGSSLPVEFAKISPQDPHANVLVSVPGTPQAREAAIAATVPQTTTVYRDKAKLSVKYDSTPQFVVIQGTTLTYAVNAPIPVIAIGVSQFYALSSGIWFVSTAPNGPWRVADSVPASIYTIPASSPLHYVTYVQVYGSTPEIVIVGYTPGYMGVVVTADGTVVYGTGYTYAPYVGTTVVYGYPDTYGYGAGFAAGVFTGFAFGFAMGAWWGAPCPWWGPYAGWGGGFQYVNINHANVYGRWGSGTVTRASGFNAWTGNQWAGGHAAGFNPYTGAHFQGGRGAVGNAYTGNYAAGRQGSFADPSTGRAGANRAGAVGNAYTGNYAAGREGANINAQTGTAGAHRATVTGNVNNGTANVNRQGFEVNNQTKNGVAWNNGNVYVGHDGNVYKHSDDGGWQQHTSGGWQQTPEHSDVTNRLGQEQQGRQLGQERSSFGQHDGAGGGLGARRGGGSGGGHFHLRR